MRGTLVDISVEEMCSQISSMNRQEVIDHILHFKGHIQLDFTEEFLKEQTDEKLKHILMAAAVLEAEKYSHTAV